MADDRDETMGINDKAELYLAYKWIRGRINAKWLGEGVQITDPLRTVIGPEVVIGKNVVIEPDTEIIGKSVIEDNVVILPGSRIVNGILENGAVIDASRVYNVVVPADAHIGPFAVEGKE